jgi:hypothetical protein
MENLQNNKTPSRSQQRHEMKVRSIQGGRVPLRGGDYVLNLSGGSVTLSFCFYKNNKKYGLTVAHFCRRVSDTVYAFNLEEPQPNGRYTITPIGKVVSMDNNTDSAVFEIAQLVPIEPYRLAPRAGLGTSMLRIPDWSSLPALEKGETLVGFGGQSRGAIGVFAGQWNEAETGRRLPLLDGDMLIVSRALGVVGQKAHTDDGDSGTLFLDKNGVPRYFHHVLTGTEEEPIVYKSAGVPFYSVLEAHPAYFADLAVEAPPVSPAAVTQDSCFLAVKASHSSTETETDLSSMESISFTNVSSVVAPVKRFEVEIVQVGDEVEVDVPRRGFVIAPLLHVPNIEIVEPPHAYTED